MQERYHGDDPLVEDEDQKLISSIEALDPKGDAFSQVAQVIARKTAELRRQEGRVPYELFISSLELSGI